MKSLKNYIFESNKPSDRKEKIKELEKYALSKGFDKVVFRDRTTPQGDFCIFLYNKSIKPKGYCVGYDGCYDEEYKDSKLSFDNCLKSAYKYIDNKSK